MLAQLWSKQRAVKLQEPLQRGEIPLVEHPQWVVESVELSVPPGASQVGRAVEKPVEGTPEDVAHIRAEAFGLAEDKGIHRDSLAGLVVPAVVPVTGPLVVQEEDIQVLADHTVARTVVGHRAAGQMIEERKAAGHTVAPVGGTSDRQDRADLAAHSRAWLARTASPDHPVVAV